MTDYGSLAKYMTPAVRTSGEMSSGVAQKINQTMSEGRVRKARKKALAPVATPVAPIEPPPFDREAFMSFRRKWRDEIGALSPADLDRVENRILMYFRHELPLPEWRAVMALLMQIRRAASVEVGYAMNRGNRFAYGAPLRDGW